MQVWVSDIFGNIELWVSGFEPLGVERPPLALRHRQPHRFAHDPPPDVGKSNFGCLGLTFPLAAELTQRGIRPKRWPAALEAFDRRFGHAVGSAAHLREFLARVAQRWLHGIRACRDVFT